MKKYFAPVLTIILCSVLSVPTLYAQDDAVSAPVNADAKAQELPYREISEFMRILELIRAKYVDTDKTTYENLINGAIKGMLRSLDDFSTYEDPEQFKHTIEDSKGSFPGVGITAREQNGRILAVSVIRDGPADRAGVKAGDLITDINGVSTMKKSLRECIAELKGPVGTKVKVRIFRPSDLSKHDLEIVRGEIAVSSVRNRGVFEGDIGYFRVSIFSNTTAADIDACIRELSKDKKLEGLIIDLRNNPGGLLTAAVETVSRFVPEGKPVVSVEGRAEKTVRYNTIPCAKDTSIPIAVLVNGNSASASEIFSGCMKDYKRAVIIGAKTFGKGSVQTLIPIPNGKGAGIRITTAKYYTPSRLAIHGNGITPDIAVNVPTAQDIDIAGHLSAMNESLPKISEGKYRDPQLERALIVLQGISILKAAEK